MDTIVVGFDDTDESMRALERAAELGGALGARLVVTSIAPVMQPQPRSVGPEDPTDTVDDRIAGFQRARDYLGTRGVEAEFVAGLADPAQGIVEIADRRDADLIVVGTRELGIVQRLLGQSVSDAVTRRANCDVLIVHPDR